MAARGVGGGACGRGVGGAVVAAAGAARPGAQVAATPGAVASRSAHIIIIIVFISDTGTILDTSFFITIRLPWA